MSANIADRVNHEVRTHKLCFVTVLMEFQLYLWPFAEAVKANVTSVMCSYNKFNETWACESEALLTGLLKDELDFQGFVVSGKSGVRRVSNKLLTKPIRLGCATHDYRKCKCRNGKRLSGSSYCTE